MSNSCDVGLLVHGTLLAEVEGYRDRRGCPLTELEKLEVFSMFREFDRTGVCSVNQKRFEHAAGQRSRAQLVDFLKHLERKKLMQTVQGHCKGVHSIRRAFCLPGELTPDRAVCNGSIAGERRYHTNHYKRTHVAKETVSARDIAWKDYCSKTAHPLRLDRDGSSPWGRACRDALKKTRIPTVTAEQIRQNDPTCDSERKLIERLDFASRFLQMNLDDVRVSRKHGRLYHPLTSCPKVLRNKIVMQYSGQWEQTTLVDLHASYWVFLVSELPPSKEKDQLICLLQNREFYSRLKESTPEVCCESDRDFKGLVQKQCLFWRDCRKVSRPIWETMQREFPLLCRHIVQRRNKSSTSGDRLGVSGLSHYLTGAEGRLFVDTTIPEIDSYGIPCLGFHDAILVPRIESSFAVNLLEANAEQQLGFVPRFSVDA